jgi:shikimate kinase
LIIDYTQKEIMKRDLIFLTGFMASGKSTIGPILANTIGWDFLDLDKVIEEKTNKKIVEIFKEYGEEYFRKLESQTLKELTKLSKHVISLGGGTIESEDNLNQMKKSGILVYLETSPEAAYRRLRFKRDRPALLFDDKEPTKEEFLNRINTILNRRLKYYNQADLKINTDNKPVGITVDKLVKILRKDFHIEEN